MTGDGALELRNNEIMPPDRDWSIRTMAEKKAPAHQPTSRPTHQPIKTLRSDQQAKKSAAQRTGAAARREAGIRGSGDQAFLPVFQS
jgi:hypothetical protein